MRKRGGKREQMSLKIPPFWGIDEMLFKITGGNKKKIFGTFKLKNEKEIEYGNITVSLRETILAINLPRMMGKETNFNPYQYTSNDWFMLENMREKILDQIKELVGDDFKSTIKKVELCYMVAVSSRKEIDIFCKFFTGVFSEIKPDMQIKTYINREESESLGDVITGMVVPVKKNNFTIKIYDKGFKEGMDASFLRMEFLLLNRYFTQCLKKDEQKEIKSILTDSSLLFLQKQFYACYESYIEEAVEWYLAEKTFLICDKMKEIGRPIKVISELKNKIYSIKEFSLAAKMFAEQTGKEGRPWDQWNFQAKKKIKLNGSIDVYERLDEFKYYIKT